MNKKNELVLVDERYLENKIYIIRGQKVMLDRDLAEIYGYSTKAFNEQVQRNIEKFDEGFMFQLTEDEAINLSSSQNVTSIIQTNSTKKGRIYRPYVFSLEGIFMLMTVLKGPLAIEQSRNFIRLFKSMKDYLVENRSLIPTKELEFKTNILEKDVKFINNNLDVVDNSLINVMKCFVDKTTYKHYLILDGKKIEADIAYKKIFKLAKHSIIYIDNYIDLKALELLSYAGKGISITIFSDNKSKPSLTKTMIDDFNTKNKTNHLSIHKPSHKFHDRYIIIDHNTKNEIIYHCGSSLKDTGSKISTITKLEMSNLYKPIIDKLLNNI